MENKGLPLVEIVWLDSHSFTSWRALDEAVLAAQAHKLVASTVGYVIFEDGNRIAVAQNLGFEGADMPTLTDSVMTIPKISILSIKHLARGKK